MKNLGFQTVQQFELLRIKFDNKLDPTNMQSNYMKRFNDIKKRPIYMVKALPVTARESPNYQDIYLVEDQPHSCDCSHTQHKTSKSNNSSIVRFMNRNTTFRTNDDLTFRDRKYWGLGIPRLKTHIEELQLRWMRKFSLLTVTGYYCSMMEFHPRDKETQMSCLA